MRPLRFLLSLVACITAFFLILYIGPWRASGDGEAQKQGKLGTYFNWRTPSSLFPPSAIISLTDDNSTFFLARPAAFGPLIPTKSLSGQLWIGSGFGDDHLGRSGAGGRVEGELGCSDMPGWNDRDYVSPMKSLAEAKTSWAEGQKSNGARLRKRDLSYDADEDADESEDPVESDGTDDHLHHPLLPSDGLKTNGVKKATHADIQSLQESAEIAGKIVLLSRGGCGFLEKVKWVQRRGGVALIVGDDIRGGPLVTMYARGDTSNVTIPSLFTSHTTAHLLSSLIPSGGVLGSINPDDARRLGLALGDTKQSKSGGKQGSNADKPNFTTSLPAADPTPIVAADRHYGSDQTTTVQEPDEPASRGWLSSLLGRSSRTPEQDDKAPDDSKVGWVLQEEFDDEEVLKYGSKKTTTTTAPLPPPSVAPNADAGDGFVIGVQDWRDPDLVAHQREQLQPSTSEATATASADGSSTPSPDHEKDESITPGSGEYLKSIHHAVDLPGGRYSAFGDDPESSSSGTDKNSKGWLSRLFGSSEDSQQAERPPQKASEPATKATTHHLHDHPHTVSGAAEHEGLWVTLTPTSMSTSPLFDTLLVLVVSPLVTLTVVYALLLLRSRIRRRRWRAPKSVVERLPVRTYQTMASTASVSSATSISSNASVTTPLLPSNARPINNRSRPRSRTTPEGPALAGSSLRSEEMAAPSLEQIEEKRAAGLSEWRRRYGGKQRECVVCLEEYIDGVSRVMSLPCGHEFHAECMYVETLPIYSTYETLTLFSTPWLTTRRRTCPICKGDVVRSLARSTSSSASPPQASFDDAEDSDEVQEQAAVLRNDDPDAAQPVSREDEMFEDLERGVAPDRTR
jgi:hypothetical protein